MKITLLNVDSYFTGTDTLKSGLRRIRNTHNQRRHAMEKYQLFINGRFVDAAGGKTFETFDPGEVAALYKQAY